MRGKTNITCVVVIVDEDGNEMPLDPALLGAPTRQRLARSSGSAIRLRLTSLARGASQNVPSEMGTEIQIGPTGQKLLPLSVV